MSESNKSTDGRSLSFKDEKSTQSFTSEGTEIIEISENDDQKSYLELHTPSIMASMEAVVDEQPESVPESMCQIFSQSVIPFLLGGCGSISAGLLLTFANKNLDLLKEVPEFLVLMPPLQGLRGNLDMTFSARMSTMAHVGEFDNPGIMRKIRRNAAVAQSLAIFVCLVANLISLILGFLTSMTTEIYSTAPTVTPTVTNISTNTTVTTEETIIEEQSDNFLFLTSASIISMAADSGICIILLFSIVYCTWKRNYNPDNIVAPLGASFSDLLTIGSMLVVCYCIRPYSEFNEMIPIVIIVLALFSVPIWICLAWEDDTAVKIARQQCLTLVLAAIVSCGAGFLQSCGALQFPNYPAYQTLISGLTGNRGAVLASRISSHLEVHKTSELDWEDRVKPHRYYMSRSAEARTAKLLLFTAVPFQLFFVLLSTCVSLLMSDPVETDYKFFLAYVIVVLIQQSFVLYLSQLLVYSVWSRGFNPDIHAIPILTSAADICGCALLYCMFLTLNAAFKFFQRMSLGFEHFFLVLATFSVPPVAFTVFLCVILATFGKSLGLRQIYVKTLVDIFKWGARQIKSCEKAKAENVEEVETARFESGGDVIENNNDGIICREAQIRLHAAEQSTNQVFVENRGWTVIQDSVEFVKAGMEAIIEDEVTSRFEAEKLVNWNMLTRTSIKFCQFVNWKLNALWIIGFFFRYTVMLPLRFTIFCIGLTFLISSTALIGLMPAGNWKRKLNNKCMLICYRILSRSITAVVYFHDEQFKARSRGIAVANHTSPIDALILSVDNVYALIGQKHDGLLGVIQRALSRASSHIWFERNEAKDRMIVAQRLREHCSDPEKLPVLIFPEGTCINNTSVMMFKKGSFEIETTIYPIAMKYDSRFGDAFWNSSEQSWTGYIIRMMTSWAIICHVWYLPPMTKNPGEEAVDFANRVKREIATKGGMIDLEWDGGLKRSKVPPRLVAIQQEKYANRLSRYTSVRCCESTRVNDVTLEELSEDVFDDDSEELVSL